MKPVQMFHIYQIRKLYFAFKTEDQESWGGGGMVDKDTGKDELCLRTKIYHKLVRCRHKCCNEDSKRYSHI